MTPIDIKFWLGYISEWIGAIAVVMIAGISPTLKKIRRIDFRYPRREATFALIYFAIIFFFAFLFFSGRIFESLRIFAGTQGGGEISQRMLISLIALVPLIILLVVRQQPLKSAGWSRVNTRTSITLGLVLVVLVIFLRGKFTTLIHGVSSQQGILLVMILVWCLMEETIFRGYIQLRLMSFLGDTWGWLVTVFLYLLWQLPGNPVFTSFATEWPHLVIALVQGMLLGWIMRKTYHVAAPALFRAFATWLLLI